MFLPNLTTLFSCVINKVSNIKIHRRTCSHCLY